MSSTMLYRPSPAPYVVPRPRLHQRLAARRWSQVRMAVTIAVLMISTALAVFIALRAPSVSPVAPPGGVTAGALPVPPSGVRDPIDTFGINRGGHGGGGGR